MEHREAIASTPVMYLAPDYWSPRYDSTFFTVKMENVELLKTSPVIDSVIGGKSNHPAYYYKMDVHCAHSTRTIHRRYSQFKWLFRQIQASPPPTTEAGEQSLVLPPPTCFCAPQNEAFAHNRMEQLREFMKDLLQRPGYSTHWAVVRFLELDAIAT